MRESTSRRLLGGAVVGAVLFAVGAVGAPHDGAVAALHGLLLGSAVPLLVAAVCWGAALRIRAERGIWAAMALTWLLGVVGNVVYAFAVAPLPVPPIPSLSDLFWLGTYPVMLALFLEVLRVRVPRAGFTTWLDGLITTLGVTAVTGALVVEPLLHRPGQHVAATAVALAYPVADVLLLALFGAVIAMLGVRRDATLLLFCAVLTCKLVGDVALVHQQLAGDYVVGGAVELLFMAGALVAGIAAHRSRPGAPPVAAGTGAVVPPRTGWSVVALPLASDVGALAVLGLEWGDGRLSVPEVCALGCVAAALLRTAVTVAELRGLHGARELARTDELTGLPNRRALFDAAEAVLDPGTDGRPAALLLLDLDGFKEVNDGLGHAAGDQVLRQLGPRLLAELRPGDLLARLGGDEFAVLLPDTGVDRAQDVAGRLRARIGEPFSADDLRVHVGVSIGVATAPVPAPTVPELLRCADVAMYAAKSGRDGVRVYVPDPDSGTGDRLRAMAELRTALGERQLEVHLQPQLRLADGTVVGAEALVRWRHPTRGLLSPADLLPAAEQAGLLRPLTAAVLELALAAATTWWHELGVPVAVNLSAVDVGDADLSRCVAAALERHGLPGRALTLEIPEGALARDPRAGVDALNDLRAIGVRTSIDDYGTGAWSPARLHTVAADELKLDGTLTAGMTSDVRTATVIRHTIGLAADLGLTVVAEGVEDVATATALAGMGCDVVQGFAVAMPMAVPEFAAWLRRSAPPLLDAARRS